MIKFLKYYWNFSFIVLFIANLFTEYGVEQPILTESLAIVYTAIIALLYAVEHYIKEKE